MLLRQGSGLGSSAGIGGMMSMRIERQGLSIEVGRMILWISRRIPRPKQYSLEVLSH